VQHVGNYTNKCVVYDQQASIFEYLTVFSNE